MGIIITDNYEDPRGFCCENTYASFSRNIIIEKVIVKERTEITQEEASGNSLAIEVKNTELDNSGNENTVSYYYINNNVVKYGISADFLQFINKEARNNGKRPINNFNVNIKIEKDEFNKIYEKLYTKVKENLSNFGFTNIVDDNDISSN